MAPDKEAGDVRTVACLQDGEEISDATGLASLENRISAMQPGARTHQKGQGHGIEPHDLQLTKPGSTTELPWHHLPHLSPALSVLHAAGMRVERISPGGDWPACGTDRSPSQVLKPGRQLGQKSSGCPDEAATNSELLAGRPHQAKASSICSDVYAFSRNTRAMSACPLQFVTY